MVCRNPDQARKDAATRAQLLAALESKLRNDGPKSGCQQGLSATSRPRKVPDSRRLSARGAYKQLWMVEQVLCFTRPGPR